MNKNNRYVTLGEEVVQKLYEDIAILTIDRDKMKGLLLDLIHPEELGYAVTQEVRQRASKILSELKGY